MHTARQALTQSKSRERIRHALQYQTRTFRIFVTLPETWFIIREKIIVSVMDQEQSCRITHAVDNNHYNSNIKVEV